MFLRNQIKQGVETITEFHHPMVVISGEALAQMSWDRLQGLHEGARERGILKTFDTMSSIAEFRQGHPRARVVLFSYEWLSWSFKGPTALQFSCMQDALQLYRQAMSLGSEDVFVWLDVLSIPQLNKGVQRLAVNSLYTYASAVDATIIVAPESRHEGTGEFANLETYKSRVWTRVEQVAHVAAHGLDSLYIAATGGKRLECASEAWLKDVVDIFSGSMTCCRLEHAHQDHCDKETLVLPLLGLWYVLCGGEGPRSNVGAELLRGLIAPRVHEIFPEEFNFVTKSGTEVRSLFGDLIPMLDKHLRKVHAKLGPPLPGLTDVLPTDSEECN